MMMDINRMKGNNKREREIDLLLLCIRIGNNVMFGGV
jgi:hypothetical protein